MSRIGTIGLYIEGGTEFMRTSDVVVVGGGIVGLAAAYQLLRRHPELQVLILEKEKEPCLHQTGRNSGVMHSGLYYKPGSIKAKNCIEGRNELIAFAKEHKIHHEICGKILVATSMRELPNLDRVARTGAENGLTGLQRLGSKQIQEIEPYCRGIAGLFVPQTGIINYVTVGHVLVREIARIGSKSDSCLLTGHEVQEVGREEGYIILKTNQGNIKTRFWITCAGLQSDRLARKDGIRSDLKIVPFRGDYYEMVPEAEHKVRHLIYPVPDPDLPFLGVHFTRMIEGGVECGPSAVFSFDREGYRKTDFRFKDSIESLSYSGTWRLFMKHWRYGLGEYSRAFSKRLFLKAIRRLLPDLSANEIKASRAGIRAQALDRQGYLLDDFRIESTDHSIHVLNAPSPAATACLAIGRTVVELAEKRFGFGSGSTEKRSPR